MKEEMEKWKKTTCIGLIQSPEVDPIKKALSAGRELSDLPIQDIEEVLLVLANYNLHLYNELGQISAKVNYLDGELLKIIAGISTTHRYFNEKKQAVVETNPKAAEIDTILMTERAKMEMLKPIVDGLRQKIEVVKRIHDRRVRSRQ